MFGKTSTVSNLFYQQLSVVFSQHIHSTTKHVVAGTMRIGVAMEMVVKMANQIDILSFSFGSQEPSCFHKQMQSQVPI